MAADPLISHASALATAAGTPAGAACGRGAEVGDRRVARCIGQARLASDDTRELLDTVRFVVTVPGGGMMRGMPDRPNPNMSVEQEKNLQKGNENSCGGSDGAGCSLAEVNPINPRYLPTPRQPHVNLGDLRGPQKNARTAKFEIMPVDIGIEF